MNINDQTRFNQFYQAYLNELTLQGKSPKTIDMYSRCIRQVSVFFDTCPDTLTAAQLKAYFLSLVQTKSWSAVKIARNKKKRGQKKGGKLLASQYSCSIPRIG
ncbi:phage integrase N-terminal SAM-like domain-containing protein [Paraglaciecola sp. MB-3u-78]|uniref:phage integrase N-terminal SAM-like domain-containing protein n=1 Tax=Paraglaciecola sp. MB-3u-78 TaxID=2058332 RepID=UPI0018E2D34D|nr:phage integrase N-terminal SAM-like domain-containing protein [Paraglaciecola sp. MB-3u-78]